MRGPPTENEGEWVSELFPQSQNGLVEFAPTVLVSVNLLHNIVEEGARVDDFSDHHHSHSHNRK